MTSSTSSYFFLFRGLSSFAQRSFSVELSLQPTLCASPFFNHLVSSTSIHQHDFRALTSSRAIAKPCRCHLVGSEHQFHTVRTLSLKWISVLAMVLI
mmetsp:Transcript_68956/g.143962  ORF Transcript_68956/g.143962 Transcript_68956/m.143962 type:complete len:97 (-) Transcript_68956:114-404(-)